MKASGGVRERERTIHPPLCIREEGYPSSPSSSIVISPLQYHLLQPADVGPALTLDSPSATSPSSFLLPLGAESNHCRSQSFQRINERVYEWMYVCLYAFLRLTAHVWVTKWICCWCEVADVCKMFSKQLLISSCGCWTHGMTNGPPRSYTRTTWRDVPVFGWLCPAEDPRWGEMLHCAVHHRCVRCPLSITSCQYQNSLNFHIVSQ